MGFVEDPRMCQGYQKACLECNTCRHQMHLTSEFKIHLEYIPIFKIEYPQFLFDTELELYLYNYREISLEYRVLRTIGQMY